MAEKLIDLTLQEYLDNSKTGEAWPGGGSVAAYVGGLGAGLAIMALNLSYGKDMYEDLDPGIKEKLDDLKVDYEQIMDEMAYYTDEDANSFNGALKAFKMPKETEEEKKLRSEAIQEGYKYALEVPLKTARLANEILTSLETFAKYCADTAITDVGCAILFVSASLEAALQNVLINVKSIKDKAYTSEVMKEVKDLRSNARIYKEELMDIIYDRIEEA